MIRNRILFYTAVFLSFMVALASFRFLGMGLDLAFAEMSGHILNRKTVFIAHIIAASLALTFGAINLWERRSKKFRTLHRWTGRAYGVSVLVGGVSGFVMATGAEGGIIAGFGFGILAVLWLVTTVQAIRLAMAGNFKAHRRWMMRSFALTFAAVTLRIYLPGFIIFGEMTYMQASVWVAWLCWVPNLAFAEWWVRR
ncbi:MAG: DUF2306 domain-containing protein [Rhodobacteraceae bacterium]|nr:DUF2306 domain-containing protein [Paracoccaceae bacterium]